MRATLLMQFDLSLTPHFSAVREMTRSCREPLIHRLANPWLKPGANESFKPGEGNETNYSFASLSSLAELD